MNGITLSCPRSVRLEDLFLRIKRRLHLMLVTSSIHVSLSAMRYCLLSASCAFTLASSGQAETTPDLPKQIAIIQAVGTEGMGNREAAAAFQNSLMRNPHRF